MSTTFRTSGALVSVALLVGWGLGSSARASSYRDKHGNEGMLTLGSPVVASGGSTIAYTVPYTSNDSEGAKSGQYVITSEMLPGRDPGSSDFVLSLFVIDDASLNAAELILRNNPNVAPAAPILRLLDCSATPCIEDEVYLDPRWGAWVIQDQSDIADYPIELLDARVILQLLEPAPLSMIPNSADGTGNWADIMENHRTNFEEVKFRADIETLGEPQSDLLTTRMIDEIEDKLGIPDPAPGVYVDWLRKHSPGISHGALSFFTGHKDLIEEMTTVLFTNHLNAWPLDFTFPFGRIPVFLIDPHDDAGPDSPGVVDPFHQIPTHWERVIANPADAFGGLSLQGCWHNWPLNAYTPLLDNGDVVVDPGEDNIHIGQFECATVVTPNGFVDRPCTNPADYSTVVDPLGTQRINGTSGTPVPLPGGLAGSLGTVEEGDWHNPIHGIIGGTFGPIGTTAGAMIFWTFHTYASTVVLSNWRHAQKRDMGTPNRTPSCNANGPYLAECQGTTTNLVLDGTGSSDPDGDSINYMWSTDCPGGVYDDDTSATPMLTVDSVAFPLNCNATLTVTDSLGASDSCDVSVTVEDTMPPDINVLLDKDTLWPANHRLVDIQAEVMAADVCDASPSIVLTSVVSDEPVNGQGDGNTEPDIAGVSTGTADFDFELRAERAAKGDGRTYTIVYTATDGANNSADGAAEVQVPHDRGK